MFCYLLKVRGTGYREATHQWRMIADPWGGDGGGDRPPEWSLESFLVTTFPNLPILESHKFFPNFKFITPGLFFFDS